MLSLQTETVYSVEEDPEPDVAEKRDKFKNRSEKITSDCSDDSALDKENNSSHHESRNSMKLGIHESYGQKNSGQVAPKQAQVTNYNRVMSNHRSVTKPKDVKYKRINKAKSKSLEELRGRLRHWVEKGNIELMEAAQSYA